MIAIGIDAAFANMGLARVSIIGNFVNCLGLQLVSTERLDKKVVRKSSDDLRRAIHLRDELAAFCGLNSATRLAFAEVPSGSLSAAAARSLGIAVGVLASCPVPIIEVSQREVKMASVGKPTASKAEMIEWATSLWPDANWLTKKGGGYVLANEHLADAMAIVVAGTKTQEFKRLIALSEVA